MGTYVDYSPSMTSKQELSLQPLITNPLIKHAR